jgi:hypothetical protein
VNHRVLGWSVHALCVLLLALSAGCGEGRLTSAPASFTVSPSELKFGLTNVSLPKTLEVTLGNQGRSTVEVSSIAMSLPNLKTDVTGTFTLEAGQTRVVKVTFAPLAEGEVQGNVDVALGPDGGDGVRQLNVSGLGVRGFVSVKSGALEFGNVELDAPVMRDVIVENPSVVTSPVKLSLQGLDADEFSSSDLGKVLLLTPGELRKVPIAFHPSRLGAASAELVAEVCDGCEKVLLPLSGVGIASRLDISPMRVEFGRVPVGATALQKVVIRNLGTTPFDFYGAALINNPGDLALVNVPTLPKGQLAPGASFELTVSYTPRIKGKLKSALLEIKLLNPGTSGQGPKLPVLGEGGVSCVEVAPSALDFGTVPEGFSVTLPVGVENRCPHDVELREASVTTSLGGYFSVLNGGGSLFVPAGQQAEWTVTFTPKKSTPQSAGSLKFKIIDGVSFQNEVVTLTGKAKAFAPCSYALQPVALDFGWIPVGAEVTLGVSLQNTGTDDCYVASMGLASGSDAAFVSRALQPGVLKPGEKTTLPIRFKPSSEAGFSALAEAWVNHPTMGHAVWDVSGQGSRSCFTLQPTSIDFGTTQLSCGTRSRSLTAFNGCGTALTFSAAGLHQGTSSEFSLAGEPVPGTRLEAGQSHNFTVQYSPSDDGEDLVAVSVDVGLGGLHTVGVRGEGFASDSKTDHFVQKNQSKVDVLWVVDNSGSMVEEQTGLANYFANFLAAAQANGIDYHIGVTTTGIEPITGGWYACPGGSHGGEAGRLFPADNSAPRVITPFTANATEVFANNVQVGLCHWNEQGIEAAYRALSSPLVNGEDDPSSSLVNDGNLGFLRQDAKLVIVFVSDEEDFSPEPVGFYETFFKSLKSNDPALLSISAIVGPSQLAACPSANSAGLRYLQLASATGGAVDSICTPSWANTLTQLSSSAFEANRRFWLTEAPRSADTLEVRVNGVPVETGWTYDASANAVVFDSGKAPDVGATVDITYPLACL